MSTRNIDLVTFENDSVVNQKSISLPIGKVSIRQTAILFSGILVTFLVFMTSDNLIMSGLVFAVFLGLGLIGSRVMAADQMIKSHLVLLIRGTSLDVKHEYMEKSKRKEQRQQETDNTSTTSNSKEKQESHKNNNGLANQILSEMQSLLSFKKKDIHKKEPYDNNTLQENNTEGSAGDKRFSAKVELTDQNILNVSLYKKIKKNQNENGDSENNPVEKRLKNLSKKSISDSSVSKPTKENLTEHVTITLDGKELEDSRYAIKSDDIISLVLENNPDGIYQITANTDEDDNDDFDRYSK